MHSPGGDGAATACRCHARCSPAAAIELISYACPLLPGLLPRERQEPGAHCRRRQVRRGGRGRENIKNTKHVRLAPLPPPPPTLLTRIALRWAADRGVHRRRSSQDERKKKKKNQTPCRRQCSSRPRSTALIPVGPPCSWRGRRCCRGTSVTCPPRADRTVFSRHRSAYIISIAAIGGRTGEGGVEGKAEQGGDGRTRQGAGVEKHPSRGVRTGYRHSFTVQTHALELRECFRARVLSSSSRR